MILASALMLDWLGHKYSDKQCLIASKEIERAVGDTLEAGVLTRDLGGNANTKEFGEEVANRLKG